MDRVAEHHFRFDFFLAIFFLILLSLFLADKRFNQSRFFNTFVNKNETVGSAFESRFIEFKSLGFKLRVPKGYSTEKCGDLENDLKIYVYIAKTLDSYCDSSEPPTLTASRRSLNQELQRLKNSSPFEEIDEKIYGEKAKHLSGPNFSQYLIQRKNVLYIIKDTRLVDLKFL